MFSSPWSFSWSFLYLIQYVNTLSPTWKPKTGHDIPDVVWKVKYRGFPVTSLEPVGCTLTNAAQDALGLLFCKGTLLAYVQLVYDNPHALFWGAVFQLVRPQPILLQGDLPSQVQDLVFIFVELHEVLSDLFCQLVKVPWITAFPQVYQSLSPVWCSP